MVKKKTLTFSEKCMKFLKDNSAVLGFVAVLILFGGIALFTGNEDASNESQVYGDDQVDMYYFYLSTCPHCQRQEEFHSELRSQFPNLKIHKYEITTNEARQKYQEMAQNFPSVNNQQISTPTTFIGNQSNVGFDSAATTGQKIINMVEAEEARIMENWDNATMVTTEELRAQQQTQQNEQQ